MQLQDDGYCRSKLLMRSGISHGFGTKNSKWPGILNGPRFDKGSSLIPATHQIHSNKVHFFDEVDSRVTYSGDAWFTSKSGIVCYVRTADCLPLLICDIKKNMVGAVHCGWRGIASHIVQNALREIFTVGSRAKDVVAVVGPHICQRCYKVGDDLVTFFQDGNWPLEELVSCLDGYSHFSLGRAVLYELMNSGIKESQIDTVSGCTYCDSEKFYSYRRNPRETGRQVNYIYT